MIRYSSVAAPDNQRTGQSRYRNISTIIRLSRLSRRFLSARRRLAANYFRIKLSRRDTDLGAIALRAKISRRSRIAAERNKGGGRDALRAYLLGRIKTRMTDGIHAAALHRTRLGNRVGWKIRFISCSKRSIGQREDDPRESESSLLNLFS